MCYETLKYRILERLQSMPYSDYKRLKKEIPQKIAVSESVFTRWLYLKKWDKQEIPLSKLREISHYLNCENIIDLINY